MTRGPLPRTAPTTLVAFMASRKSLTVASVSPSKRPVPTTGESAQRKGRMREVPEEGEADARPRDPHARRLLDLGPHSGLDLVDEQERQDEEQDEQGAERAARREQDLLLLGHERWYPRTLPKVGAPLAPLERSPERLARRTFQGGSPHTIDAPGQETRP